MKYAIALSISLLCCSAVGAEETASVHSSHDWDPEVSRCITKLNDGISGRGECQQRVLQNLKRNQSALLKRIYQSLSMPGLELTDYNSASKKLALAQSNWERFINADCTVVGDVFGQGTDRDPTVVACLIDHYKLRSTQLRFLQRDYLNER
jgi:uncharacterized protein YecT (DUF1311 family)